MKFLSFCLLALITMLSLLSSAPAQAAGQCLPYRQVFNSSTLAIKSNAYYELVSSTVKGVASISVLNTGIHPLELAFGPAGSEVVQIILPKDMPQAPVVIPVQAGYGIRISAISLDADNDNGELELNICYN